MSGPHERARSTPTSNRRLFLKTAATAVSTAGVFSLGSGHAVAIDATESNGSLKPIATRVDSAASFGTGGYKLHNSGQLDYNSSFPNLDKNGSVDSWIHHFTISGFGYTVTHINGPNDEPYFGNHLIRGGTQRIGQYIRLETDDAVGLSPDQGAKSGGWLHPEAIWENVEEAVGNSSYTMSEVAEELHDSPDTKMAEQFFDSDVESLEGEIKHYIEEYEEIDGDRYDLDDFAFGVLMTAGGMLFSILPYGAAINYGVTAGELAYSAYDGMTGDPDKTKTKESNVSVGNPFDNSVKYPESPTHLTIDDEGTDIFEGQGTPMRGHHISVYFETPTGNAFDSWDVEIEQGFDVTAYNTNTADSNDLSWKLELPTGSQYSSQNLVQSRMRNAMSNVRVEPPSGQHDSTLLYH